MGVFEALEPQKFCRGARSPEPGAFHDLEPDTVTVTVTVTAAVIVTALSFTHSYCRLPSGTGRKNGFGRNFLSPYIKSFVRSFTHSFFHSFIHQFACSVGYSLICSSIHSN